jgi:dUTP pyrophosphatase
VKHGIHIGAGVIDPDYVGEVKVAMFNLGLKPVEFKKGDRIAQLILERCEVPDVLEVDTLVSTSRGEGGFGSTGN